MFDIVSRNTAQQRGLARYFTGQPCRNGHVCERRVVGGHCIACVEAAQSAWRDRLGSDGLKAKQREYDTRFARVNPEQKLRQSNEAVQRVLQRDPDYYRRAAKQWRKNNPAAFAVIQAKSLATMKAADPLRFKLRTAAARAAFRAKSTGSLSPDGLSSIVRNVWDRSGGHCAACASDDRLELDHIVALANGGTNEETNFQFLCEPCNRSKGTKDHQEWLLSRSPTQGVAA